MNRRRLSKRQQVRIAARQQQFLPADHGQTPETGSCKSADGLVVSHFGQLLDVEVLNPHPTGTVIRCHQRSNLPDLVTGDRVKWKSGPDSIGVIEALGERRNLFSRTGFAGKLKPVAANLETVVVVVAAIPEPGMNLIDRYLVAVAHAGLQCILVLNKIDLQDSGSRGDLRRMLSVYRALDFPVAAVSAKTGQGMQRIHELLRGKTTIVVGQSGVGKSSLINRLGEGQLTAVGPLSPAHDRGTHTTTTTRLFHLAGFDLIDSPGIREFGLGHMEANRVVLGFPEIAARAGLCKFRNCRHENETDCAVLKAAGRGQVHPERLQSYRQIVHSIEAEHKDR